MSGKHAGYRSRRWWNSLMAGSAVVFVLLWAPEARSQDASVPTVVRVEEDWTLVLNEPADSVDSPQFHTTMSPVGDTDHYYAQVTWNYRYAPDYMPGGLQLHSWYGDTELSRRGVRSTELSTTAETITWTQVLYTDGSLLTFEITNGSSTTWGWFGRDMAITQAAVIPDLNAYDPQVSVGDSWITYGANRVDLLVLTEVRRYDQYWNLISSDPTWRVVYQAPAAEQ